MTTSIDPVLRKFFDSMSGCWGCKDRDSVFQYANAEYGRIIGLPHHLDVIGRTDFDMPCKTAACAQIFREQDQAVIQSGRTLQILDIHPFADGEWQAYLFTKKLWLSTHDDTATSSSNQARKSLLPPIPPQTLGTIFHGLNITHAHSAMLSEQLSRWTGHIQNSYTLATTLTNTALSAREAEILFLLLRGKTAKLIAHILAISPRTIEQYLSQLKQKFGASNKAELIDCAIAQGYLNVIPPTLFNTQLSIILATH